MNAGRSLALLAASVAIGGLAMGVVYGASEGLITALLLLATGTPVLVASFLLVRHRARLGPLSRQLGAGVAVPVALALVGIEVIALVLFVSPHDAFTMALLLACAGVLATYSAWSLTSGVTRDIAEVRDAVTAVGRGERSGRVGLRSGDELGELAAAVGMMTEELARADREREEMERARRDLLAAVSHDLRSPLSSMRLLIDAIRDGVAGEDALDQVAFNLRSLESLIEDLFELSRIEAGDVAWPVEPVVLQELIEETVEGMRGRAEAGGVRLTSAVAESTPPVRANPEKLQRVLFNLVDNALRHTPPDGTIAVEARGPSADAVELEVSDSGAGIADDDRTRVFEPFFRGGPAASRPRNGAGLGLPICRAIVEAHGGTIAVVDRPGGTCVRVRIPAVAP